MFHSISFQSNSFNLSHIQNTHTKLFLLLAFEFCLSSFLSIYFFCFLSIFALYLCSFNSVLKIMENSENKKPSVWRVSSLQIRQSQIKISSLSFLHPLIRVVLIFFSPVKTLLISVQNNLILL